MVRRNMVDRSGDMKEYNIREMWRRRKKEEKKKKKQRRRCIEEGMERRRRRRDGSQCLLGWKSFITGSDAWNSRSFWAKRRERWRRDFAEYPSNTEPLLLPHICDSSIPDIHPVSQNSKMRERHLKRNEERREIERRRKREELQESHVPSLTALSWSLVLELPFSVWVLFHAIIFWLNVRHERRMEEKPQHESRQQRLRVQLLFHNVLLSSLFFQAGYTPCCLPLCVWVSFLLLCLRFICVFPSKWVSRQEKQDFTSWQTLKLRFSSTRFSFFYILVHTLKLQKESFDRWSSCCHWAGCVYQDVYILFPSPHLSFFWLILFPHLLSRIDITVLKAFPFTYSLVSVFADAHF